MKRLAAPLLILLAVLLNVLPACDGLDDHYSTNPTHRLSFSRDTLSFDTVFTTIGSATRQFMIYNHNNEPLNIESVMLAGGAASNFRINVDGRRGDHFTNVGILNQDSMFVLVEVTVDPNGENQPLMIEDSVVFTLNGIRQSVLLEAYGQDVTLYKGGHTISKDTTLTAERPFLVYDSIVVAKGATVHIEKGATFYMHDKAYWVVSGTLNAVGTQNAPITFRGDRLDFILNDLLPYDRTPAQWGGLFFKPESYNNVMNYTIIRNGTTGLTFEQSTPDKSKLKISNSQVTNMKGNLFSAINSDIEAINCEFTNAQDGVMILIGGKYSFTHCTLANFMTLVTRLPQNPIACLSLLNHMDKATYPLNATFTNCIIDGNKELGKEPLASELALSRNDQAEFNYHFNHCVIKTNGKENENFTNVLFGKGPSYRATGEKANKYRFDFRPDSATTVGVGKAELSVAQKYPIDRYGVNRITGSTGPTIGAYEFVPKEDNQK